MIPRRFSLPSEGERLLQFQDRIWEGSEYESRTSRIVLTKITLSYVIIDENVLRGYIFLGE